MSRSIALLGVKRDLETMVCENTCNSPEAIGVHGRPFDLRRPTERMNQGLGFWGVEDQFCPSGGYEKILRAVPDSRFIMYARTGHWAMIEQAQDFNQNVIDFLRR